MNNYFEKLEKKIPFNLAVGVALMIKDGRGLISKVNKFLTVPRTIESQLSRRSLVFIINEESLFVTVLSDGYHFKSSNLNCLLPIVLSNNNQQHKALLFMRSS